MIDSTAELPPEPNALTSPPVEPRLPGQRRRIGANGDIGELLAAHAYSASNWVAMHCRRHMELYGTTKEQLGWLAVNSRRNAALNPACGVPRPDDHGRLPRRAPDLVAAGSLRLRRAGRRLDRRGRVAPRLRARLPQPPDRRRGHRRGVRLGRLVPPDDFPKMASTEAAAQMWSRTELTPHDVDVAELYDGFTYLTVRLARGARAVR